MDTLNTQTKTRTTRPYNNLGKFFAKIRIDLNVNGVEWAKTLNVSPLTLNRIERGNDKKLPFTLAKQINEIIRTSAPQHLSEYTALLADELDVLLIPAHATERAIEAAKTILEHGIKETVGSTVTE